MKDFKGTIVLVRAVPGNGKTSFCKDMAKPDDVLIAADDFFYDEKGNYNWDPTKLSFAHKKCKQRCEKAMSEGKNIFVHNTFIKEQELTPYLKLAEKFQYKIYTVIIENRNGTVNQHEVPEEKLVEMEKNLRNNIKLR